MKKRNLLLLMLCCAYFGLLIGCGPSRIQMKLDTYSNPDLNISEYKRFSFLPANNDKPLMEKELFSYIKIEMEKKGYIYDDKMPQFIIVVQAGKSSHEKQKRVRSREVSDYQPPPIGSKDNKYGTWETHYVTEGGGSYTVNTRWMKIDFIDVINKKPDNKITYLWQGEVNSDGRSELSEVVKCLISGLLRDYPAKLTSSKITLKFDECK